MAQDVGRALRNNAFLVGAVGLPLVVICLFLLSTAIPRWTVPPPAYDLLLHTTSWRQEGPRVSVEFVVLNGRVQATIRPRSGHGTTTRSRLWLFDHAAMTVREIPVALPERLEDGEAARTIEIEALAGRQVLDRSTAPDGYEVQTRSHSGPGVVGDLFGMRRSDRTITIANRGRAIPIRIPAEETYQPPAFIGWMIDE